MMEEIFQKSKITPWLSGGKGETTEGEMEMMMRKWREELGEVLEKIKGMKD